MSATIVITEEGVILAHNVSDQNALILAQHALNLHMQLLADMERHLATLTAQKKVNGHAHPLTRAERQPAVDALATDS